MGRRDGRCRREKKRSGNISYSSRSSSLNCDWMLVSTTEKWSEAIEVYSQQDNSLFRPRPYMFVCTVFILTHRHWMIDHSFDPFDVFIFLCAFHTWPTLESSPSSSSFLYSCLKFLATIALLSPAENSSLCLVLVWIFLRNTSVHMNGGWALTGSLCSFWLWLVRCERHLRLVDIAQTSIFRFSRQTASIRRWMDESRLLKAATRNDHRTRISFRMEYHASAVLREGCLFEYAWKNLATHDIEWRISCKVTRDRWNFHLRWRDAFQEVSLTRNWSFVVRAWANARRVLSRWVCFRLFLTSSVGASEQRENEPRTKKRVGWCWYICICVT